MPYDIDFTVQGDIKLHIKRFFLHPPSWEDPANQINMTLAWQAVEFDELNESLVPERMGVYAFSVKPEYQGMFETNYLCYIGKTSRTLRKRFSEYIENSKGKNKPRPKVFSMMKMFEGYLHFNFAPISAKATVDMVEDKLINTFVPHVNVMTTIAKIKPEYHYLYE